MDESAAQMDSFLHITDLHFWESVANPLRLLNKRALGAMNVWMRRRTEFIMERAEPFADAAAATGVKPVLLTGDFSSTATEKELAMGASFVRGLERRGLSPTTIPGNHDVYTFESLRKKRYEKHFSAWSPGETLPAVRSLPGGTPVLFVPTVRPNVLSSKGFISDRDVARVAELLETLHAPVVVAGHYPLLFSTYGYATGPNRRLLNAAALREALGRSGRNILYLSGHVHRFSYVRDEVYPNLAHLTTGAFFRTDRPAGSDGEFAEVRVRDSGFDLVRHRCMHDWVSTTEEIRSGPNAVWTTT